MVYVCQQDSEQGHGGKGQQGRKIKYVLHQRWIQRIDHTRYGVQKSVCESVDDDDAPVALSVIMSQWYNNKNNNNSHKDMAPRNGRTLIEMNDRHHTHTGTTYVPRTLTDWYSYTLCIRYSVSVWIENAGTWCVWRESSRDTCFHLAHNPPIISNTAHATTLSTETGSSCSFVPGFL